MAVWPVKSVPTISCILTFEPMINSARITLISQPPPIKNEMYLPFILKVGEVRVPCGLSPCTFPLGEDIEGLFSNPPIHQSPC